jgi:hypothetical protein
MHTGSTEVLAPPARFCSGRMREQGDDRIQLDPMTIDRKSDVWRKDGRKWCTGRDADVAWIEQNTESGLTIGSAIPSVFEAYATLELPVVFDQDGVGRQLADWDQHVADVLATLRAHTAEQSWWLGYLDSGAANLPFHDARRVKLGPDPLSWTL